MYKKIITIIASLLLAGGAFAYSRSPLASKVSTDNLLALSWQNAFCQTHQKKKECRNIKPNSYTATHFTLHGLWPQPRSKQNCKGKRKVYLDKPLYLELLSVMPAAKGGLQHHEWKKHGTCYGTDQAEYFEDSILLIKQFNNSAVQNLFAKNIGKTITKEQVMRAFDNSYGKGSGRKVKMMCNKGMISELQINLGGEIKKTSKMADLLKGAKNAKGGCKRGKVDRVGF